jgi:hypothetical protein
MLRVYFQKKKILSGKPNVVIIDDLMPELGNDKKLSNLFTLGNHKDDLVLCLYPKTLFIRISNENISLNCHYMLLMKNPRVKTQIIASQIYPNNSKFLTEVFNDNIHL